MGKTFRALVYHELSQSAHKLQRGSKTKWQNARAHGEQVSVVCTAVQKGTLTHAVYAARHAETETKGILGITEK